MKGKLKYENWYVVYMGFSSYRAERIVNENHESKEIRSHCLACAKVDILNEYGGKVDLRGWHRQGNCGAFLKTMQDTVDMEEYEERD